jgi:hypothetical protein
LLEDGWDSDEEGGTVVQEEPGKKVIFQHNLNMVAGSGLLPLIDEEQEKLLVYGTLDHGDQNWAMRVFYSGTVRNAALAGALAQRAACNLQPPCALRATLRRAALCRLPLLC